MFAGSEGPRPVIPAQDPASVPATALMTVGPEHSQGLSSASPLPADFGGGVAVSGVQRIRALPPVQHWRGSDHEAVGLSEPAYVSASFAEMFGSGARACAKNPRRPQ